MKGMLFAIALAIGAAGLPVRAFAVEPAQAIAAPTPEASQTPPTVEPGTEGRLGKIVVVPIKGEISAAKFFFLRRALKEAAREDAGAVILDMDTYGGSLNATVDMQKALAQIKVRTFTYINPNAGSAGALIALSTQEIYVAPIAAIGAAAPVSATGEDLSKTMSDKQVSYASAYFGSVAERNGHNPDLARAFINKEMAVKVGEKVIHEKGSVLTLSAQEAIRKIDGKPLLAAGMADSMADLLKQAGLKGEVQRVEPKEFEQVAFWITTLAPLFLLGGIVGAWVEIKSPGFGLPGIASAICFAIFFTGHYVAGLAGWEAPVLFLIGLALVLGEVMVHPGTILPGLAGLFLMVGALLWAMVDRYPGQPWVPSAEALEVPLLKLGIAGVLAVFTMALLAQYLPKTRIYQRLVLGAHNPAGPAFSTAHSEFTGLEVGARGVALSILRPSGKAEFSGQPRDVITTGEFVEAGTPIRVLAVEGSRIVVAPVV